MTALPALAVFVAAIITDVAWARYTYSVAVKRVWGATGWAVGIILTGAVNINYIAQNLWYVLPAAAGAAIGTFFTVRREASR